MVELSPQNITLRLLNQVKWDWLDTQHTWERLKFFRKSEYEDITVSDKKI